MNKGAGDESHPCHEWPTFEFVEHLRELRDSNRDCAPYWYLPAFRLLPLALLVLLWALIDVYLLPINEALADSAKLGLYLLCSVTMYFIHTCFYEPRYGWPWPPHRGVWDQVRSLPKYILVFLGLIALPITGLVFDSIFAWPISCTLVAVSVLLLIWWWLAGTKGRLFHAEEHWRLATMGLSFPLVVWELTRRHYYLILAGAIFAVGLAPSLGLANSQAFANVVTLELFAGPIIAVCTFFDDLRLKRLYGDLCRGR